RLRLRAGRGRACPPPRSRSGPAGPVRGTSRRAHAPTRFLPAAARTAAGQSRGVSAGGAVGSRPQLAGTIAGQFAPKKILAGDQSAGRAAPGQRREVDCAAAPVNPARKAVEAGVGSPPARCRPSRLSGVGFSIPGWGQ
nr:hypothetical protein [Tanacetum cinerariifolium]